MRSGVGGLVVVVLLLSGCAQPSDPLPGREAPLDECPLLYPDNSTFDCASDQVIRDGIQATKPGLDAGWFCHAHNENDNGYGVVDLLIHRDGRLGFYWTSSWQPPGGFMFAQASIYYADGTGDVGIVGFEPAGFVELPFRARGSNVDVHLLIRHHVLDIKIGNGAWYEEKNATMLVGTYHGDPWYVWKYDAAGATHFLDTMVYSPDPETYAKYAVRNQFHEAQDHSAFATAGGWGAKFLKIALTVDPARHATCQV